MKKKYLILIVLISMLSCSSFNKFSRYEIVEIEKNGKSVTLDSVPIKFELTYLNQNNISNIKIDKKTKTINIIQKDKKTEFYSIDDLKTQNKYNTKIDKITINGSVLDSLEISKVRFEKESIQYIRLLTQKDYSGKEYDDLPQVRETIGNGILIIKTE